VWDMIGDSALNIRQEGHSIAGAPEVVTRVWGVAKELGYGKYFLDESMGGITDDHWPLLRKGLRVIDVIDINYCADGARGCDGEATNLHHSQGDTIDRISAKSLQIIGDVALTLVMKLQ
jgi:glutaminyl-peptide cyclotransferase